MGSKVKSLTLCKDIKTRQPKDKYRYLFPLTKEIRNKIIPLEKPYPKNICLVGEKKSQSAIQQEVRGAIPTTRLQLNVR